MRGKIVIKIISGASLGAVAALALFASAGVSPALAEEAEFKSTYCVNETGGRGGDYTACIAREKKAKKELEDRGIRKDILEYCDHVASGNLYSYTITGKCVESLMRPKPRPKPKAKGKVVKPYSEDRPKQQMGPKPPPGWTPPEGEPKK